MLTPCCLHLQDPGSACPGFFLYLVRDEKKRRTLQLLRTEFGFRENIRSSSACRRSDPGSTLGVELGKRGHGDNLGTVGDAALLHDIVEMSFHRALGEAEIAGNLFIGLSAPQ